MENRNKGNHAIGAIGPTAHPSDLCIRIRAVLREGRRPTRRDVLEPIRRRRQIPVLCAIMGPVFMFRAFVGHMFFAIFPRLGLDDQRDDQLQGFPHAGWPDHADGGPAGWRRADSGGVFGSGRWVCALVGPEMDFVTVTILGAQTVIANSGAGVPWAGSSPGFHCRQFWGMPRGASIGGPCKTAGRLSRWLNRVASHSKKGAPASAPFSALAAISRRQLLAAGAAGLPAGLLLSGSS